MKSNISINTFLYHLMTNHNSIIQYNTGWLRMCAKICCGCHFLFIFLVLFSFFLFVNFVLVHIFYLRELLYSKNSDFLHICASYVLSVFYKIFFVSPFKSFFNPFLSLLSLSISWTDFSRRTFMDHRIWERPTAPHKLASCPFRPLSCRTRQPLLRPPISSTNIRYFVVIFWWTP